MNTVIRMGTTFADEIGLPKGPTLLAVLMIQFVGIPFAFAFGLLADRIGAKRSIYLALAVYTVLTVLAYGLSTIGQFFAFAFTVAMVMGGIQALSRSLFASLIPQHKAGEMFGFFGIFDRFGGAIGSAIFGAMLAAHRLEPPGDRQPRRAVPARRVLPLARRRGARAPPRPRRGGEGPRGGDGVGPERAQRPRSGRPGEAPRRTSVSPRA